LGNDENIDDPLHEKALSIVGILNRNGIDASISKRLGLLAKVEVAGHGFLCVYYRSKSRTFTTTYNELRDKQLAQRIEFLLKTDKTEADRPLDSSSPDTASEIGKQEDSIHTELDTYARKISENLLEAQIDNRYLGIYNNMYARISIKSAQGDRLIDIYNTKKLHLDIRYDKIDDAVLKEKIVEVIREIDQSGSDCETPSKNFRELDFLYRTLYPFKDFHFDFSCFKSALERVSTVLRLEMEAVSEYSFYELEKAYFMLKERCRSASKQ
jgi:hypothetical protein